MNSVETIGNQIPRRIKLDVKQNYTLTFTSCIFCRWSSIYTFLCKTCILHEGTRSIHERFAWFPFFGPPSLSGEDFGTFSVEPPSLEGDLLKPGYLLSVSLNIIAPSSPVATAAIWLAPCVLWGWLKELAISWRTNPYFRSRHQSPRKRIWAKCPWKRRRTSTIHRWIKMAGFRDNSGTEKA